MIHTAKSKRIKKSNLDKIQNLRLFDDEFLREVFSGNIGATELLLNVIFDRDDITVISVISQREIKELEGHSVRLDIVAEDREHHVFNVEIQRRGGKQLPFRSRYCSSLLDTTLLKEGEDYSCLVPTYVIFFMETDTIGEGLPIYHYIMKEKHTGKRLGDERHIIFINGANKDERTLIGKLVHDFHCTKADDMYFKTLAKRVRYFKETERGREHMSSIFEEYAQDVAIDTAIDTYRECGFDDEKITERIMAKYDLSREEAENYVAESYEEDEEE
ncbi:MAG: PD-(D/E)XK nuclease family transposase [Lachnospiraceae bacterium]|nr:PD-(D/E)XK nuclease family transposase [Lachnospiraceae bacterium]